MSGNIVNTNLRLNLDNAEDRQAWERLQAMDKTRYKSYSRAVVAALNDFFDRQERMANDRIWKQERKRTPFYSVFWTRWSVACAPRRHVT